MAVWVLLILSGLTFLVLLGFIVVIRQEYRRVQPAWTADRLAGVDWDHDVRRRLDELKALLQALQEAAKEPQEIHVHTWVEGRCQCGEWWTGAFLPTDQAAAQIERQVRDSEDHAISATEPIRFSSRPSSGSGRTSRREPSTQRRNPSGGES